MVCNRLSKVFVLGLQAEQRTINALFIEVTGQYHWLKTDHDAAGEQPDCPAPACVQSQPATSVTMCK